jgi:hypothetical protein
MEAKRLEELIKLQFNTEEKVVRVITEKQETHKQISQQKQETFKRKIDTY